MAFIGKYRKLMRQEKCVSKSQDSCQNVVTTYKKYYDFHALINPHLNVTHQSYINGTQLHRCLRGLYIFKTTDGVLK